MPYQGIVLELLRKSDTDCRISAIFLRETTFVTLFGNASSLDRNNLLLRGKFSLFKINSYFKQRQTFDRVAFLVSVSSFLKRWYILLCSSRKVSLLHPINTALSEKQWQHSTMPTCKICHFLSCSFVLFCYVLFCFVQTSLQSWPANTPNIHKIIIRLQSNDCPCRQNKQNAELSFQDKCSRNLSSAKISSNSP